MKVRLEDQKVNSLSIVYKFLKRKKRTIIKEINVSKIKSKLYYSIMKKRKVHKVRKVRKTYRNKKKSRNKSKKKIRNKKSKMKKLLGGAIRSNQRSPTPSAQRWEAGGKAMNIKNLLDNLNEKLSELVDTSLGTIWAPAEAGGGAGEGIDSIPIGFIYNCYQRMDEYLGELSKKNLIGDRILLGYIEELNILMEKIFEDISQFSPEEQLTTTENETGISIHSFKTENLDPMGLLIEKSLTRIKTFMGSE